MPNTEYGLSHVSNNHTREMIEQWKRDLPPNIELYWSHTADGWAIRKRGTKQPFVQLLDDGCLFFRGTTTPFRPKLCTSDLSQMISHMGWD